MGLFRARKGAWRPADTRVLGGGDIDERQVGESYAVRFVRDDKPGALITVAFCGIESAPGKFVVHRQIEWLVCEDPADPGSTEIWSDLVSDEPMDLVFATAVEAEVDAHGTAEDALCFADAYGRWDGEPVFESGVS